MYVVLLFFFFSVRLAVGEGQDERVGVCACVCVWIGSQLTNVLSGYICIPLTLTWSACDIRVLTGKGKKPLI